MSRIHKVVTLQLSYFYEYLINLGIVDDNVTDFETWCNGYLDWLKSFTNKKKEIKK